MEVECSECGALHWNDERLVCRGPVRFGTCCNSGQVKLPLLEQPPDALRHLFTSQDDIAQHFRQNIIRYNAALAFTSLGAQVDRSINRYGPNAWVFRIHGRLHHLSSALENDNGEPAKYSQLYIYDPSTALTARMQRNSDLNRDVMQTLQQLIHDHNPYAAIYKHAYELLQSSRSPELPVRSRVVPGADRRRYNLPTANEVAIILPDSNSGADHRDILLRKRANGDRHLIRISEDHAAYAPLAYPLIYTHGEAGWHSELQIHRSDNRGDKKLTKCRHTAFHLHTCRNHFSTIHHAGRLFQQWVDDMYVTVEQERVNFDAKNQNKLHASLYSGLLDAVHAEDDNVELHNLGKRVILPSSYVGGPRYMQQAYQDAMALARRYWKVDLFITITANPAWTEVTDELEDGQTSYDRPDLVVRVFHMKLKALIDDITKNGIFRRAVAYVYTIEFQKRGLPHAHILIFFKDGFKLLTINDIDSCISAKWPDPEKEPLLFATVRSCMVHGPCGSSNRTAPCMENGKCTKFYPKEFRSQQQLKMMDTPFMPAQMTVAHMKLADIMLITVGLYHTIHTSLRSLTVT